MASDRRKPLTVAGATAAFLLAASSGISRTSSMSVRQQIETKHALIADQRSAPR
jgi:hypothetical protein